MLMPGKVDVDLTWTGDVDVDLFLVDPRNVAAKTFPEAVQGAVKKANGGMVGPTRNEFIRYNLELLPATSSLAHAIRRRTTERPQYQHQRQAKRPIDLELLQHPEPVRSTQHHGRHDSPCKSVRVRRDPAD